MPDNDAKIGHLRTRYASATVQHLMRSPDKHLKLWNPFTVEITQADNQTDPGLNSPVNFKLTFSDAPSPNPTTAQWNTYIALSGTAGATTRSVTGSGATRNVAVSGMTQPGTVIINIAADQFTRAGGQYNEAATLTDNQITYHGLFVTIAIAQGQTNPGYGSQINWTVTFSESVSDFTAADITIYGGAAGTKTATVTGAGTTYNVKITGMTGDGSVWFRLAAGSVSNQYGGTNPQTDSPTVTYDAPKWRSLSATSNGGYAGTSSGYGSYNTNPNSHLSQHMGQAEALMSYSGNALARMYQYAYVGYHGYQDYPLGWPSDAYAQAIMQAAVRASSAQTPIPISDMRVTIDKSRDDYGYSFVPSFNVGVFGSMPSASAARGGGLASASGTGRQTLNLSSAVGIFNSSNTVYVTLGVDWSNLSIQFSTNSNPWDPSGPEEQWYLGTVFYGPMTWYNSTTPNAAGASGTIYSVEVYY